MSKESLYGIPHILSALPNSIDLAIINAAISIAVNAANKQGKITGIKLSTNEGTHKTLQVKVDYER